MSQSSAAVKSKWIKRMIAEGRCARCGFKPDPDLNEALDFSVKDRPMCEPCRFKYLRQQSDYYYNVRKKK